MKKILSIFVAAAAVLPLFAAQIKEAGGSISANNGKLFPYLWSKKGQVFSMTGKSDDGKAFGIVLESLIWYHGRSGNTQHIYQDQSEANWKVQKTEIKGNLIKSYTGNIDFDVLREIEFFEDDDALRFEYIVTAKDDREIARLNFPILRLNKEIEKISFADAKMEKFTTGTDFSLKDTGRSIAFFFHYPKRNKTVLMLVDLNTPLKYGHEMGLMPSYSHGGAKSWCRTMSFQHIYRWAFDFHKTGEKTGVRFYFKMLDGAELSDAHKQAARDLAKKMKVEPAKFDASLLDNIYRYPSTLAAKLPAIAGVNIWSEITTKRIYPAMEMPKAQSAALKLASAANERESIQIAFNPASDAKLEKLTFTDLVSDKGDKIAAKNFYANMLGVQKIAAPRAVFYGETRYPDKLIPMEDALPAKLKANQNSICHLTFYAPAGTKKGIYKGFVNLRISGKECKLPVELKVWGFELPKKSNYTAYGLLWSSLPEHINQIIPRMAAYNWSTTVYQGGQKELRKYFADGKELRLPDNFEIAEKAVKTHGYNMFAIPYVFLGAWNWTPKKPVNFLSLMIDSPEFDEKFVNYLKSAYRQVKARGLVDNAFLYIWDEMTGGHYAALEKTMNMVRKHAPGVRALTVAAPDPQVLKHNDIIVTGGLGAWWGPETAKVAEKALADGKELWIYLNGITFATDVPPNIPRLTIWQNYVYGFTGFLQWSMDYNWKYGSFEKNGLTWILYPGYEKPIYAARLEYFRDGVEDYNMFCLSRKLPAAKKAVVDQMISKIAPKDKEMSQDPVLMYQTRNEIGEYLDKNL